MSDVNPSTKVGPRSNVKPASGSAKRKEKDGLPAVPPDSDVVRLSTASRVTSSGRGGEIRQDVVDKFKSLLGNGGYKVKADEIADKMVQKIRENKGPSVF